MGACECENPMEFGYEVNALEKDEQSSMKNKNNKDYNSNISNNNDIKNINELSNVINIESKVNMLNNYNEPEKYESPEIQYNDIKQFSQQKVEGVNALRARYENEKNPNDETDANYYQQKNNNDNKQIFNTSEDDPSDDFSNYMFENINKIRQDPKSFIDKIEKAKANIKIDKKGLCIYKSSVKVALSRGKPAFDEAIDYLRNLKPMPKLIFSPELLITPPINEEQIKDRTYMNEIINEKVQAGIPIKSFWRDIIKDRETCLILMIVDDTGANSGKKRNDILDPSMQCIGITSKKIGKNFASYVTLC